MPDATAALSPLAYQLLQTLPALRGLSEIDRAQVTRLFREEYAPRGATVVREGEAGASLYVVVTGEVEVTAAGRVVARLGPGEWFGEMAVLTGTTRSATVQVTLDCRILVLEREAVARLLACHPRLYEELATILSRRLARLLRGEAAPRHLVIGVDNRGAWPERPTLVAELAASLERQLGRPIGLVQVVTATREPCSGPRPGRPDAVLAVAYGEDVRERLATRLAAAAGECTVTLVEVDEAVGPAKAGVFTLVDTVLVLGGSATDPEPAPAPGVRRVVLQDRRRGSIGALGDCSHVVLPMAESRRGAAIDRLARTLVGRSIGIALGSGTAYGLAHIGVLSVLEAAGVPIDLVAGSSMGAVVGAAFALGVSTADLSEVAVEFGERPRWLAMAPSLVGLLLDRRPLSDLFGGDPFLRFLAAFGPVRDGTFADLELPFRAVATDIGSGARVELCQGPLLDAIRASASVPGVLSPYRIGDRVLVDGGASDPVPSETVRAMGADLVLAINAVPPLGPRGESALGLASQALEWLNPLAYVRVGRPSLGSIEVALRSLHILQHELGNARASEADVLITPRLEEFSMLDFRYARTIIERGAEAARASLGAIRARLDRAPAAVRAA